MTIQVSVCPKCHESFKGHFGERIQFALRHIKDKHAEDYEILRKAKTELNDKLNEFQGLDVHLLV